MASPPDTYDGIGGLIALLGLSVIMYEKKPRQERHPNTLLWFLCHHRVEKAHHTSSVLEETEHCEQFVLSHS